jgi:hypothetical protein
MQPFLCLADCTPKIPITFGWIAVGTQTGSGTIKHALEADKAFRAEKGPSEPFLDSQEGIEVRSGLTPQAGRTLRTVTERGRMDATINEHPIIPPTWGMDICGDERLIGPIYNYARVFTWWSISTVLHDALSTTIAKIERENLWKNDVDPLVGDGPHISDCCGLKTNLSHQILAYPQETQQPIPDKKHKKSPNASSGSSGVATPVGGGNGALPENSIELQPLGSHINIQSPHRPSSGISGRMAIACIAALFVQWTTTMSAFIMAFLTPTVGIGCRSGGYLLYGTIGTIVMILMIISMLLSNRAMQKYQSRYSDWTDTDEDGNARSREMMFHGFPQSALCKWAVGTRACGKALACANMLWLISSSIFEYIGLYNTCWCKSCFVSFGHKGWAVLFKSDQDFQSVAQGPWAGGIAMSTIVSAIFVVFFALGPKKSK